jgi:hypothetical protein
MISEIAPTSPGFKNLNIMKNVLLIIFKINVQPKIPNAFIFIDFQTKTCVTKNLNRTSKFCAFSRMILTETSEIYWQLSLNTKLRKPFNKCPLHNLLHYKCIKSPLRIKKFVTILESFSML